MPTLLREPHPDYAESSEKLGACALIAANTPRLRLMPAVELVQRCMPAILHDQLLLIFNDRSEPHTAIAWATLAPDVEARLIADPGYTLHYCEWNEGESLWVMTVLSRGDFRAALSLAFSAVPLRHKTIRFFRPTRDGGLKLTTWELGS